VCVWVVGENLGGSRYGNKKKKKEGALFLFRGEVVTRNTDADPSPLFLARESEGNG